MALILKENRETDSVLGGAFLSFSDFCLLARWMWVINKYSFRKAQIVFHVLIKYLGSETCLQKKGSETGFLAQNQDRLLDRDFQGRISAMKAEQVLKTFSSMPGHPVLF